jgi:hypothetical protein
MIEPMDSQGPLSGSGGQPKGALASFFGWLAEGASGKLFRALAILGVLAAVICARASNDGVYRGGD